LLGIAPNEQAFDAVGSLRLGDLGQPTKTRAIRNLDDTQGRERALGHRKDFAIARVLAQGSNFAGHKFVTGSQLRCANVNGY
jgi:hypothetical protein